PGDHHGGRDGLALHRALYARLKVYDLLDVDTIEFRLAWVLFLFIPHVKTEAHRLAGFFLGETEFGSIVQEGDDTLHVVEVVHHGKPIPHDVPQGRGSLAARAEVVEFFEELLYLIAKIFALYLAYGLPGFLDVLNAHDRSRRILHLLDNVFGYVG